MNDDQGWPALNSAAYHGPLGRLALAAAPHTEADPAALLLSELVVFGTLVGSGPHVLAGNVHHPACLFGTIVGDTAKARKGTALAPSLHLVEILDAVFAEQRVMGGFGSGEKLVDELAGSDQGPPDPRLLVVETEFAKVLRVSARDGSVLSQIIRDAWDGRPLQARSRGKTSVAKEHHVGVLGHITAEELRLRMCEADIYGGLANRFLWCCARKSQQLPTGGNVPSQVVAKAATTIEPALWAAKRAKEAFRRTGPAEQQWADLYIRMADDDPGGLLGAAVCRDAPQVLRLSLTYALADQADAIDTCHLDAAWALWSYCRASAALLFGDSEGDARLDRLLAAIVAAGPDGLDGTGQFEALGRHVSAKQLEAMRRVLEERGRIVTETVQTDGRPRLVSYAVAKKAK
jgi:hypothetical protein